MQHTDSYGVAIAGNAMSLDAQFDASGSLLCAYTHAALQALHTSSVTEPSVQAH